MNGNMGSDFYNTKKKSNMSSVAVPKWFEMQEFKQSIGLDEKDLVSMSLEELCQKYDIPMP